MNLFDQLPKRLKQHRSVSNPCVTGMRIEAHRETGCDCSLTMHRTRANNWRRRELIQSQSWKKLLDMQKSAKQEADKQAERGAERGADASAGQNDMQDEE